MKALQSAVEDSQVLLKIVRKAHIQRGVQSSETTELRAAEVVQKDIVESLLHRYNLWRVGGFLGLAGEGQRGDRAYSLDNILRGRFPWRAESTGEGEVTLQDFGYCLPCLFCGFFRLFLF